MFVEIANTPRDYAWGSTTAMAELLGTEPSGRPEAELWFGAHVGSPSRIVAPAQTGGARDLSEWIAQDPAAALGNLPRLPFLLKVLAGGPLSMQAHPTEAQAVEGFARENALGIPVDAPHRNYRDAHPKPEVIFALSERFDALCGFRAVEETSVVLRALGLDELVPRLTSLPDFFAWLMSGSSEIDAIVSRVVERAEAAEGGANLAPAVVDAVATVRMLAQSFPGDAGIVSALLLNRVTLTRGEALVLPAGNIHAYLNGVGIEVMTASDNVLRGGLTPKHVDVPELLRVLDMTPGAVPRLPATVESSTLEVFRPGVDDFVLAHVTGDAEYVLTGPAIALCTSGSFTLEGILGSTTVSRGDAVYVTPDESRVAFTGSGEVFVATTP
jgi:mannose-6-phosphate isomerase